MNQSWSPRSERGVDWASSFVVQLEADRVSSTDFSDFFKRVHVCWNLVRRESCARVVDDECVLHVVIDMSCKV